MTYDRWLDKIEKYKNSLTFDLEQKKKKFLTLTSINMQVWYGRHISDNLYKQICAY